MQRLNYYGQEFKKQFAVYDSDTPVTLKRSKGHRNCYELVDLKKGYNNAKFEKPCWNKVRAKANDKDFVKL